MMATVCIQCALEGFVASDGKLAPGHVNFAQTYGIFDETPEEHMARVHATPPDPALRAELEAKAEALLLREMAKRGMSEGF